MRAKRGLHTGCLLILVAVISLSGIIQRAYGTYYEPPFASGYSAYGGVSYGAGFHHEWADLNIATGDFELFSTSRAILPGSASSWAHAYMGPSYTPDPPGSESDEMLKKIARSVSAYSEAKARIQLEKLIRAVVKDADEAERLFRNMRISNTSWKIYLQPTLSKGFVAVDPWANVRFRASLWGYADGHAWTYPGIASIQAVVEMYVNVYDNTAHIDVGTYPAGTIYDSGVVTAPGMFYRDLTGAWTSNTVIIGPLEKGHEYYVYAGLRVATAAINVFPFFGDVYASVDLSPTWWNGEEHAHMDIVEIWV